MTEISKEQMITKAQQVIETEAKAVCALKDQLTEDLTKVINIIISCKGHVLIAGAGTSWAIAERFAPDTIAVEYDLIFKELVNP